MTRVSYCTGYSRAEFSKYVIYHLGWKTTISDGKNMFMYKGEDIYWCDHCDHGFKLEQGQTLYVMYDPENPEIDENLLATLDEAEEYKCNIIDVRDLVEKKEKWFTWSGVSFDILHMSAEDIRLIKELNEMQKYYMLKKQFEQMYLLSTPAKKGKDDDKD